MTCSPPTRHLAVAAVERHGADGEHLAAHRARARAAQHGADAAAQLGQAERLGDIVVGAGLETLDGVGLGVERGQHDDRHDVALLAQRAADVIAVGPGAERDVEQDHVELLAAGALDRLGAVGDRLDGVALLGEGACQRVAQRGLVVDDEDVHRSGCVHRRSRYRLARTPEPSRFGSAREADAPHARAGHRTGSSHRTPLRRPAWCETSVPWARIHSAARRAAGGRLRRCRARRQSRGTRSALLRGRSSAFSWATLVKGGRCRW